MLFLFPKNPTRFISLNHFNWSRWSAAKIYKPRFAKKNSTQPRQKRHRWPISDGRVGVRAKYGYPSLKYILCMYYCNYSVHFCVFLTLRS